MANQEKVVYDLSNGAIFNDLEQALTPVFKVTLFFDAEYLINGLRYDHSYYGRQTGNRTKLSNGTSLNDRQ